MCNVVWSFDSVLSLEESVKSMSLTPEEDDIPWDTLRDNRDLTVLTSWDPRDRWVLSDFRFKSADAGLLPHVYIYHFCFVSLQLMMNILFLGVMMSRESGIKANSPPRTFTEQ